MQITPIKIKNRFPDLISEFRGDPDFEITGVGSAQTANQSELGFVFKPSRLNAFLESSFGALVVPQKVKQLVGTTSKVILFSPNPELAMALIVQEFFVPKYLSTSPIGIHRAATISPKAKLGKEVCIGANVVIADGVTVGDFTQISANTVIEENVKIGTNCRIYPLVFIGRDCEVGNDCIIQAHVSIGSQGFGYAHDQFGNHFFKPHLGRVRLGNKVEVGAGTQIDRGTVDDTTIGDGTKIDNLCHFGHNAIIGKNCLITANFVSAGSAKVGNNFVCGGRTSVAGHIEVGDNITVAAHSTVSQSCDKPGQYGGYPLVPLQTYMRNTIAVAFLAEMRKNITRLMKQVFKEEPKP